MIENAQENSIFQINLNFVSFFVQDWKFLIFRYVAMFRIEYRIPDHEFRRVDSQLSREEDRASQFLKCVS
jgi:hypothetical protein